MKLKINTVLVKNLILKQFYIWKNEPIIKVTPNGWDNKTFRLGKDKLVRLPSADIYASQVQKEQKWLPILQPHLPLIIPNPIAMGSPCFDYPYYWSIYKWIDGEVISLNKISDIEKFAIDLADFLLSLQKIKTDNAPLAGQQNFYRGASLLNYESDTLKFINLINDYKLREILLKIWRQAINTNWQKQPVWLHGDISINNLLFKNNKLHAVIDFGQLAIGDPACDLSIAWMFFDKKSRNAFLNRLNLDYETCNRAKAWALWKVSCSPIAGTNCQKIINEIIMK